MFCMHHPNANIVLSVLLVSFLLFKLHQNRIKWQTLLSIISCIFCLVLIGASFFSSQTLSCDWDIVGVKTITAVKVQAMSWHFRSQLARSVKNLWACWSRWHLNKTIKQHQLCLLPLLLLCYPEVLCCFSHQFGFKMFAGTLLKSSFLCTKQPPIKTYAETSGVSQFTSLHPMLTSGKQASGAASVPLCFR